MTWASNRMLKSYCHSNSGMLANEFLFFVHAIHLGKKLGCYFFRVVFFTTKLRIRYRDFPYTHCPHTHTVSSTINIPHHSGTLVTAGEPTPTHHNQSPEFTVDLLLVLYILFRQMYSNVYSSQWYHSEYLHYPKNPIHPTSLLSTPDLFTVSVILPFQNVIEL